MLVTGPTGSGKTTTLAALLDHINRSRAEHILTIEDPIEFTYRNEKASSTSVSSGMTPAVLPRPSGRPCGRTRT